MQIILGYCFNTLTTQQKVFSFNIQIPKMQWNNIWDDAEPVKKFGIISKSKK